MIKHELSNVFAPILKFLCANPQRIGAIKKRGTTRTKENLVICAMPKAMAVINKFSFV